MAGPLVAVEKQGQQFTAAWHNARENELLHPRAVVEQLPLPLDEMVGGTRGEFTCNS